MGLKLIEKLTARPAERGLSPEQLAARKQLRTLRKMQQLNVALKQVLLDLDLENEEEAGKFDPEDIQKLQEIKVKAEELKTLIALPERGQGQKEVADE